MYIYMHVIYILVCDSMCIYCIHIYICNNIRMDGCMYQYRYIVFTAPAGK